MRRITVLIISILLLIGLSIPVWGANQASKVQVTANVSANESCQVTVVATLHVEENNGEITYPVPRDATGVTLNGRRVRTKKTKQAQNVDLSKAIGTMTGDFVVTITYALPDVIETGEAGTPELRLPLLSGYENSISRLDYTVTMPGEIQVKPAFSSGYHKADIEKDLYCTVNGMTVVGYSTQELKDHETLTMIMDVDPLLFPNAPIEIFETNVDDIAMIVCGVLAILYWILFLRAMPFRWKRSATAPEGVTAGELGAIVTLGRADLSLMVFSWAQLGYIQMQVSKKRVLLHKQMDMGNERTAFEQKCFRRLFEKRDIIDTGGLHYAILCRNVAKMSPSLQSLVHPRSGNIKLFRAVAALIGLFCGVSFAIAMTQNAVLQVLWIILLAGCGLLCGWFMQEIAGELVLRKTAKTVLALVLSALWLLLGLIAGQFGLALAVMLAQWVAGIMAFYGGRRTEAGLQDFARIIGLRWYLMTVSKEELKRLSEEDPEYFYSLMPDALALGVNRSFARRFPKGAASECPYITMRSAKTYSPRQWSDVMNRVLKDMNRRGRVLPIERFLAIFSAMKK